MGVETMEAHVNALEGAYKQVADRLNSMDSRLDHMDSRLDHMESRLDHMDSRLDALRTELRSEIRTGDSALAARMDTQFRWLVAIQVTCFLAAAGGWVATLQVFANVLIKAAH